MEEIERDLIKVSTIDAYIRHADKPQSISFTIKNVVYLNTPGEQCFHGNNNVTMET